MSNETTFSYFNFISTKTLFFFNQKALSRFFGSYNNHISSRLFHSLTPFLSNWNIKSNCILTLRVFRSFNLFNKLCFKNIFFKFVKDFFIWEELSKMLNANIIGVSGRAIYNSIQNFCNNRLSFFLLSLYLKEFEIYLEKIVFKYNLRKNFQSRFFFFVNKRYFYSKNLACFTPLKSEKNLIKFLNIKFLIASKYDKFHYSFLNSFKSIFYYEVYIFFIRYLDFFIFKFTSSRLFVSFLMKKLLDFLYFKINFLLRDLVITDFNKEKVLFCGYLIVFYATKINFKFDKRYFDKFFFSKVIFRIMNTQKILSKTLFKRFKTEFLFKLRYFGDTNFKNSSFVTKFWNFLFQLQSVETFKIQKLILAGSMKEIISNNILIEIKRFNTDIYYKYLFNLHNMKINFLFENIIKNLTLTISLGSLYNDFFLYNYLIEFKKHILLQGNIYSAQSFSCRIVKNFFGAVDFFTRDCISETSIEVNYNIINYHALLNSNDYLHRKKSLFLFVPVLLLIKKFRLLGFIHPSKNCPIGNLSLILFSDHFIIKISSFLVYSILNWYSFSKNLLSLKILIELVRESCLLTLCRKHNKNKSWAYTTYTSNLVFFTNLYCTEVFFPTKEFIKLLHSKKNFLQKNFQLDESIFCSVKS
jgi:hypothetical protein